MPHFLYFSEGISFRIFPSFFFLNRELLFDSQHIFEKKQKLLSLKLNCSFLDIRQLLFLPKLQVGLKYLICFLKYGIHSRSIINWLPQNSVLTVFKQRACITQEEGKSKKLITWISIHAQVHVFLLNVECLETILTKLLIIGV